MAQAGFVISLGGDKERDPETIDILWDRFDTAAETAPNTSGIYFLGAPFGIQYPKGCSSVFYIGSAVNLRKRLKQHLFKRERGNFLLNVLLSKTVEPVKASFHSVPKLKALEVQGLEYGAMHEFGRMMGMIPHGNRMPPECDYALDWLNKVQLREPSPSGEILTCEQIAERFNLGYDVDPWGIFAGLIAIDLSGKELGPNHTITSLNFYSKEPIRRSRKDKATRRTRAPKEPVPYDQSIKLPRNPVDLNLKGKELEQKGCIDNAIECYLTNIRHGFDGSFPYDRLATIYRKRKDLENEIMVLQKAVEVFERVSPQRSDRDRKLSRFKERLEKARSKVKN